MMQPLIIQTLWDALSGLGLGTSIVAAIIMGVLAYELYRFLGMGRRAGGLFANAMWYLIVVIVALGAAIGLGWVSPNVNAFAADVSAFGGMALDWAIDTAQGVIEG